MKIEIELTDREFGMIQDAANMAGISASDFAKKGSLALGVEYYAIRNSYAVRRVWDENIDELDED